MFLRSRLVALHLPRIVQLEESMPEIARLVEVGVDAGLGDREQRRLDDRDVEAVGGLGVLVCVGIDRVGDVAGGIHLGLAYGGGR